MNHIKPIPMQKLHQKLHLQHHRHTGKLLHHRHTSYRGLAVVFVLAGGLMLGVSALSHAAADSLLSIYGTAPVAIPAAPAVVTEPADGSSVNLPYVLVAGSCPLVSPQVVVAVDIDGDRAGSAACDSNNDFSVPVTLSAGSHSLVARIYTITGETGPASNPVRITYQVPAALAVTQPDGSSATDALKLSADAPFLYLGASRTVTWTGTLAGSTGSHHILIDWGDNTQDEHTVQPGALHLTHHYGTVRSYNLAIFVGDTSGTTVRAQYAVAAYTLAPIGTGTTGGGSAATAAFGTKLGDTSTIFGLYGLFLSVVAVCAIIWLEAKHHARHAGEVLTIPLADRQR